MSHYVSTTYVSTTDTAKLIRKSLRAAYPEHKFSVRSDSYANGSSIRVSWTDGPTEKEVDALVGEYAGASFDGMTDSKSYRTTTIEVEDGTRVKVQYGADFVFTSRTFSPEFLSHLTERIEYSDHTGSPGTCPACYISFTQGVVSLPDDSSNYYICCTPQCAVRLSAHYTSTPTNMVVS